MLLNRALKTKDVAGMHTELFWWGKGEEVPYSPLCVSLFLTRSETSKSQMLLKLFQNVVAQKSSESQKGKTKGIFPWSNLPFNEYLLLAPFRRTP